MGASSGVKTILNKTLRISDISKLNDPYDVIPGVSELPDGYEEEVDVWEAAENLREKMSKEVGILCFSGRYNDPVMWAHYAENHAGMCFEFDPTVLDEGVLQKIEYVEDRPCVSFEELHSAKDKEKTLKVYNDSLAMKAKSWSYEDEYRIIFRVTDHDLYDGTFQMPHGFLKSVIVGVNCEYSSLNVRKLLDAVGLPDVQVKIALINQDRYQIDSLHKLDVEINMHEGMDAEETARGLVGDLLSRLGIDPDAEQGSAHQSTTAP